VREVMETDLEGIPATTPDHEVAQRFAREDLVSAPVLDDRGRLLGRITVDDVVDVIIEDADEQLRGMAGLDESSDTFAPVLRTTRRRAVWLGINLVTAIAAAAVISLFETTIAKVVALAVLMPIVPSMGGIAATQTLTLTIRGMALGHIARANVGLLLNRELLISILNGLLWSSLIALGAVLWFGDPRLGIVIAAAVIVNMFVGAAAGAMLPLILERLDIDPAVAGGVIVTTITDVVGFFVFLGLAAAFFA
jgi:magnesium transporter